MNLILKPIKNEYIPLVEKWLKKDYILKWYHEPDEWIREIKDRSGEFSFLHHFIVFDDDKPFAFCQYYDCYDAQEEWYIIDSPGQTYSIDYLIGEENYLGKGHGKGIVKLLISKIHDLNPNAKIIVQPENENIASCKALLANGFVYDEEMSCYKLV